MQTESIGVKEQNTIITPRLVWCLGGLILTISISILPLKFFITDIKPQTVTQVTSPHPAPLAVVGTALLFLGVVTQIRTKNRDLIKQDQK